MNKNIMFLASNFPPYDGGRIGSSIRSFTLSEFLAKNNYVVHVVIPIRYEKDREIPVFNENIKIHKYFSPFQYYDHAKKLNLFHKIFKYFFSGLRKILKIFLLDPRVIYSLPIILYCTSIIKKNNISIIISSSPPITVLIYAKKLKKIFKDKLVWIADIRDVSFLHPSIRKKKEKLLIRQKKIELELIKQADRCLVVSIGMEKTIHKIFNNHNSFKEKCLIIENGYIDSEEIPAQKNVEEFVKKARKKNRIILTYAGSGILNNISSNKTSNKTLNRFVDVLVNDSELCKKYSFIIQGVVKNAENYFSTIKTDLEYLILPSVTNSQMRANLKLSDIGLNINVDKEYSSLMIGGKIYDYCISELALLLVFPDNPYSLMKYSENHSHKPYFADVFNPDSIRKVLHEIADNPEELNSRKFIREEMFVHNRENQYKKILTII